MKHHIDAGLSLGEQLVKMRPGLLKGSTKDSISTKRGTPDGRRGRYGQANRIDIEAYKVILVIEEQGHKPTAS
jgi:hypothetical protein